MGYGDGMAEAKGGDPMNGDTAQAPSSAAVAAGEPAQPAHDGKVDGKASPRRRVAWIDVAKAITMFLVVYGHLNTDWIPGPSISIWVIYLFHMPAFFFLSGIFFSTKRSFAALARHRAYQLLVPYYCFAALTFVKKAAEILISWLRHGDGAGVRSSLLVLLRAQIPVLFDTTDGLWFLWSLFNASLLLWCVLKVCRGRFLVPIAVALLLADQVVRHYVAVPLPFMLNRVLSSTAYLALGYALRLRLLRLTRAWGALLFVLGGAAFAVSAWWADKVTASGPWTALGLANVVASLFGIGMVIGLARMVPPLRAFRFVGESTLIYYCINNPMVNLCEHVSARLVHVALPAWPIWRQDLYGIVLVLVAMAAIAVLVVPMKRYLWWAVGLPHPAGKRGAAKSDSPARDGGAAGGER